MKELKTKEFTNKNVKYMLILMIIFGIFDSLWSNTILVSYLEIMMGDPYYVGIVEAVYGMSFVVQNFNYFNLR